MFQYVMKAGVIYQMLRILSMLWLMLSVIVAVCYFVLLGTIWALTSVFALGMALFLKALSKIL